jgi:hypothetical protein
MEYLRHLVEEGAAAATANDLGARGPVDARPRVADDRPRAGGDRGPRLPRLLPRRVGHRRVLQPGEHLLPGTGERGEQCRVLRARHHEGRRDLARPAVRALPVARA